MSNKISIFNASAEDFAIEAVDSLPTGTITEGRLVKYLKCIYVYYGAQWVKFNNLEAFQDAESSVNAQISKRTTEYAARVAADVVTDSELLDAVSAQQSAVSSINARATTSEASLQTRLDAGIADRVSDVSSLQARSESAEVVFEGNLATESQEMTSAITSLTDSSSAEISALDSKLDDEISTQVAEAASLSTRIGELKTAQEAGDATLAANIAGDATARGDADTLIAADLTTEEAKLSALEVAVSMNAEDGDIDTFAEAVSYINAVDVANDAKVASSIQELNDSVSSLELAGSTEESKQVASIIAEETSAAASISTFSASLDSEISSELSFSSSMEASIIAQAADRVSEFSDRTLAVTSLVTKRSMEDSLIKAAISTEASHELSGEVLLLTNLSDAVSDRQTGFADVLTSIQEMESEQASSVQTLADAREAADSIMHDDIVADTLLRIGDESDPSPYGDAHLSSEVASLTTERSVEFSKVESSIIAEESDYSTDYDALVVRIANEVTGSMQADDTTLHDDLSTQMSTERSRINSIMDGADADTDTFVELMAFINGVDVDRDDALSVYVASAEASEQSLIAARSAGDVANVSELNTRIAERISALTSLETSQEALITQHSTNVAAKIEGEDNRHLRVDFGQSSPVTSFVVTQAQLTANSGFTYSADACSKMMVQVFQDMGSNQFRNLVAPVQIGKNGSGEWEVTVQLGSTGKSGFAVLYFFNGDEGDVTESGGGGGGGGGGSVYSLALGGYPSGGGETEAATSSGAAFQIDSWSIKDYANATTDEYGYSTFPNIFGLGFDLGAGAQTNWYMRIYNASSPASFSLATYTFDGTEVGNGYGGDSISGSGTPAFPVSLSEGDVYEIYAEIKDPSGSVIATAGSSSAPYFGSTPDSWTATPGYQPGQYTLTMGSAVGGLHGDTVSVTVTVPSGNAGASSYDQFLSIAGNYGAHNYGWYPYNSQWTWSGDTSIVESYGLTSQGDSAYMNWSGSSIPAAGTYNLTAVIDAQDSNGNAVGTTTFNITVVVLS